MDFDKMTPADFPRYGDRDCPHPPERQEPDGLGTVCLDCAVLQIVVTWR